MSEPKVYVGTYKKYNEGSLKGKWFNLNDYADEDDFLKAALEFHKDEEDPELMFQDFEGFPEEYYNESGLSDKIWEWLKLDKEDRELLEVYVNELGNKDADISEARDAFYGTYSSKEDWAEEFLEQSGGLGKDNAASYLTMTDTDKRIIAGEEADNHIENASDEDILSDASMENEYEEETDEKKKAAILDAAKEEVRSAFQDEVEEKLEDPVDYFVDEQGMYSIEELMKQNFISIDYEAYARDCELNGEMYFAEKDSKVWVFTNS